MQKMQTGMIRKQDYRAVLKQGDVMKPEDLTVHCRRGWNIGFSKKMSVAFVAALSLGAHSTAGAQTAAEETPESDDNPVLIAPIVVEGERIGRTLQETRPGISVLSGEDVGQAGNLDIRDAIEQVPNVVFEEGPYVPSIRGLDGSAGIEGSSSVTAGVQPRVPIIIDGVAIPVPRGIAGQLGGTWDLDSVEVGRGPQPTTSGRNAIAGAVRVNTNDPSNELEIAGRSGYFTQDGTYTGAGLLNFPIVDNEVALRLSAEGSLGEGFIDTENAAQLALEDDIDSEHYVNIRGKLLLTPEDLPGLEVLLSLNNTRSRSDFDPGAINRNQSALVLSDTVANPIDIDQTSYSARISYDINDRFSVSQQFSFLETNLEIPPESVTFDLTQDVESFTSDTTVSFTDLGLVSRGFIGLTYERESENIEDTVAFLGTAEGLVENIGFFGEVEVDVLDDVYLVLGARYEIDSRERDVSVPLLGVVDSLDVTNDAFLPKLGIRYAPTDDLLLGYTYTEGFRGGGLDFNIFAGAPFFIPGAPAAAFESETLSQHEAFAKASLFDDRVTLEGSLYRYVINDPQVIGGNTSNPFLIGNLGSARAIGVEVAGRFTPSADFSVGGGLGFQDTKITDGGNSTFEGSDLPRAPNFTANLDARYTTPIGLGISTQARFVDEQIYTLGTTELDSYVVVDLGLDYEYSFAGIADMRFDFFVKNLLGESYEVRDFDGGAFIPSISVGRPRTFGFSATLTY